MCNQQQTAVLQMVLGFRYQLKKYTKNEKMQSNFLTKIKLENFSTNLPQSVVYRKQLN